MHNNLAAATLTNQMHHQHHHHLPTPVQQQKLSDHQPRVGAHVAPPAELFDVALEHQQEQQQQQQQYDDYDEEEEDEDPDLENQTGTDQHQSPPSAEGTTTCASGRKCAIVISVLHYLSLCYLLFALPAAHASGKCSSRVWFIAASVVGLFADSVLAFFRCHRSHNASAGAAGLGKEQDDESRARRPTFLLGVGLLQVVVLVLVLVLPVGSTHRQAAEYTFVFVFALARGTVHLVVLHALPRSIVWLLALNGGHIARLALCYFVVEWTFAVTGVLLFRDSLQAAAEDDWFIQGLEFATVPSALLSMLDLSDWSNSYLMRAVERSHPFAALYYFVPHLFISRYILLNLVTTVVVSVYTSVTSRGLKTE